MNYQVIVHIVGHNSGSSSMGGSQGGGLSFIPSSRLRTITNLTRKLSLSNSRILTGSSSGASSLETTNPINRIIPTRGSTTNSSNSLPPHSSHVFKASRSMNGIGRTTFLFTRSFLNFHFFFFRWQYWSKKEIIDNNFS